MYIKQSCKPENSKNVHYFYFEIKMNKIISRPHRNKGIVMTKSEVNP